MLLHTLIDGKIAAPAYLVRDAHQHHPRKII